MRTWEKLGLIFTPRNNKPWRASHASVPIAEHIEKSLFKIYYSSRDQENKSHTCYFIFDINKPNKVIKQEDGPILQPGNLGEFDDSGAMASWLLSFNNKKMMYYIGWNLGVTVPFRNSVGLAVQDRFGNFKKFSNGPIIDRTASEPHFSASCCVLHDEDIFKIWYLSCTGWELYNEKPRHYYHIKYAESIDGVNWDRHGTVAIDFNNPNEYAISRPSVIKDKDLWKMWYSYRGDYYKIGYAESKNGINWIRYNDRYNLTPSNSGWDSEMVEYPYVFDFNKNRYMLYNGNGYGYTGIGLAVLS